jgi:hypothetical protein
MTNALNAKLVRITTRVLGGSVSTQMPLIAGKDNRFDVVVEGIAGSLLSASGQPYSLEIVAFDISAGTSPHSESNNFTQKRSEAFEAVDGWPSKVATFTVTLNDIAAVQGHLLRYYAILTSANDIVSFVESPMFLLYRHDPKFGASPQAEEQSALLTDLREQINANDARIANLYTAPTGGLVEDNSPNAGPPRATSFDLIVKLEAGKAIGQGGGEYRLNFTAINENTGTPEPTLVPAGNPFIEQFLAPDWQASGADFVRTGTGQPSGILRFNIPVGSLTGRFRYNLDFVSSDFQVTDLWESNSFILI